MLKLTDLDYNNIDEGLYELNVSYYALVSDKEMVDNTIFKAGTEVRMLTPLEENQFFVETVKGDKSLFWVSEYEVKFSHNKDENWSSDDVKLTRKYIYNDFL